MILGIGIDIIEVERIRKILKTKPRLLDRIFTETEKLYIKSRGENPQTVAGIFSAKEAISKAIGTGIRGFKWKDLEIYHDSLGKPKVMLKNDAELLAAEKGISDINLSISHIEAYGVAFAIANGSETTNKEELSISRKLEIKLNDKDSQTSITKRDVSKLLPIRKEDSHKGTYGKIGIIAGSTGMIGASYLSTMAAMKSGSGLVYGIVPKSLDLVLATKLIEVITKPVEDLNLGHFVVQSYVEICEIIKDLDIIAMGPGMGVCDERIKLVSDILRSTEKTIVLDADGINCVTKRDEILKNRNGETVITPHPGELSRLLGVTTEEIQSDRIKYARITSEKYGVVTVLKGHNTVVSGRDGEIYINKNGNPGMSTAGSGDVLTGIIASFIGQKLTPLEASITAVYVHGLAGDMAAEEKGQYGIIASDILEKVPYSIKRIMQTG